VTFTEVDQVWDYSIRNDFLPCDIVPTTQRTADELHDPSFDATPGVDQSPHAVVFGAGQRWPVWGRTLV
jgi:hypothetical protein